MLFPKSIVVFPVSAVEAKALKLIVARGSADVIEFDLFAPIPYATEI